MFMTTMSTIPIPNQNSYPMVFDNSLLGYDMNRYNMNVAKNDPAYNKHSDNLILFPQSMTLN